MAPINSSYLVIAYRENAVGHTHRQTDPTTYTLVDAVADTKRSKILYPTSLWLYVKYSIENNPVWPLWWGQPLPPPLLHPQEILLAYESTHGAQPSYTQINIRQQINSRQNQQPNSKVNTIVYWIHIYVFLPFNRIIICIENMWLAKIIVS